MHNTKSIFFAVALLTVTFLGHAQKGTGNKTGIARSGFVTETTHVSGQIQKVLTEPCTQTTGRYSQGTHLLVKSDQGQVRVINVHLGPTQEVSDMTEQLERGQEIQLTLFRTNDMPDEQYIAKELTSKNRSYVLRDENFRPLWAGSSGRNGRKRR